MSLSKALYSTCSSRLSIYINEHQLLLGANLRWVSALAKGSQALICWWLTCDGLVSCPGGVRLSSAGGANLRWIGVLCRGESDTHLLVANLPWISVLSRGSQTLICWWLTCDGYSVLSRGSQTLDLLGG